VPKAKTWKCIRVSKGVVCGAKNPSRVRKCQVCRKWRPKKHVPSHKSVLKIPYAEWVERFGEVCGICGREPSPHRRLDRDHLHEGDGTARGLLCVRCNRSLRHHMNEEWLEKALEYIRKVQPWER
jgi:hypothetical protein